MLLKRHQIDEQLKHGKKILHPSLNKAHSCCISKETKQALKCENGSTSKRILHSALSVRQKGKDEDKGDVAEPRN
jgi:hypothetical protein